MSYEYSENILVQESAGNLLKNELGWDVKFAYNTEILGKNGSFGRTSYKEILLTRYFQKALRDLNPWITDEQIEEAQKTFENILSTSSLLQINEEKYKLIRDGIPVTVKHQDGRTEEKKAIVIDFQNPDKNYFLAIKELKIHRDFYRRRTDIVGFVNGIPLLFIELKNFNVDVKEAYDCNYTDYVDTIPHLFYYNAFLILSNGEEAKVGTLGSSYEFFHEWKRLKEEDKGNVELATMLRGICRKETLLDLLENFILYDHSDNKIVKILSRNHQYLGVNEAIEAYKDRKLNNGKLGVFWHTQGSGKSYSMLFLAQKIRRKFGGSPTIVILTDRDELNKQISDTFENCGLLGNVPAKEYIASSGNDLASKLDTNKSFIFTLIHKFNKSNPKPIIKDYEIIIMSDEAHRSQYGIFAENMCRMLPNASRIGFTGTPLLANDNITERTFGGYISIYDFQRAVEDGATVPLYYENRGEKILNLENPEITEQILNAIEEADLNEDQQEKLESEFAKEIHILTAEPRLKSIAKDFVKHYSELWTSGKAMFVCLNKVTCVRMYNFVQDYWKEKIQEIQQQLKEVSQQEYQELQRKLKWMQETEMAVVISQEQNEIQTFKKWGLDIEPHRKKMETRSLDEEYKDTDNPFRIVFVCAMWLTGFDVKSLSCLYLDKPLKAHTLMQTIARANRVAEGKSNGLIIDYIGIVNALKKALSDYTKNIDNKGGSEPTVNKEVLIKRIYELIDLTVDFFNSKNFDINNLINAKDFDKIELLQIGANAISPNYETKKQFTTYANELIRLVKYINREDITEETHRTKNAIIAIYKQLQKKRKNNTNIDLMVEINNIINEYVVIEPNKETDDKKQFDISKIDFDLLAREFAKSKKKNLILRDLEELVAEKLDNMMHINPTRIDYYNRYQEIIDEYNSEQNRVGIEKTFMDLMNLANSMDNEQKRYVREGFDNDEELSLYDLLFKENLSAKDIKELKKVAVDLLKKIKEKIAELDHWTDKDSTKADVHTLIRDTLWQELPESYDDESINDYTSVIYEHIYTKYKDAA